MRNGNEKRYLDQMKVTRYAKVCALLKKWDARKEELRAELLDGIEQGKDCPRGGPYILAVVHEERKVLSWKDEWITVAKKLFGDKWRKEQTKVEEEAPRMPIVKLLPQVNPDFRLEQPDSIQRRRQ